MMPTLLFLIVFGFAAALTPVAAQTPVPATPQAASDTQVSVPVNFSQTQNGVIVGLISRLFPFVGTIAPFGTSGNRGLMLPDVTSISQWWQTAFKAMTPKSVQEDTAFITHPLTASVTTQLCVPTSENRQSFRPIAGVLRAVFPQLNSLTGFSQMYGAFFAPNQGLSREQRNFEGQLPDQTLAPGAGLPCGTANAGSDYNQVVESAASGEQVYSETEGASYTPAGQLGSGTVAQIIQNIRQGICRVTPAACNAVANATVSVQTSSLAPYSDTIARVSDRDSSGKRTGFLNAWIPKAVYLSEDTDAKVQQPISQTVLPVNVSALSVAFRGFAGVAEAATAVKCMITPQGLQSTSCRRDWRSPAAKTSEWAQVPGSTDPPCAGGAISDATPVPDGSFKQALAAVASEQHVPECVLAGIAHIEGGWRYTQKSVSACKPANNCSATGPMQFTTGPRPGIDCAKCGAGFCPNTWEIYGAGGNPCNYKDSISAAARLIKAESGVSGSSYLGQEAAIEDAGYQYYGSKKGVCRLAAADGRLRSYGQFLVDYCKNYAQ